MRHCRVRGAGVTASFNLGRVCLKVSTGKASLTSALQSHFLPIHMCFLTGSVSTGRPTGRFGSGLEVTAAACFTQNNNKAVGDGAVLPISRQKLCTSSVNKKEANFGLWNEFYFKPGVSVPPHPLYSKTVERLH